VPTADSTYRVLLVLDHFYPHVGGGETMFWELSRALVRQGHRVNVVTSREPDSPRRESIAGVEIHRVGTLRWFKRYSFILVSLPTILRKARSADVIHTILYGAAIPAWLAATLLRKPGVLSVYEVFGSQWHRLRGKGGWQGWCFRAFEWLILRLPFTRVMCISEFTRRRLVQFAHPREDRSTVVYPAVDYEFWNPQRHAAIDLRSRLGLAPDAFIYLYFGRPGLSKGIDALVAAAAEIRREVPHSRLVLLLARQPADGYERILRQIRELELQDHAHVLAPVPRNELPGYLLAANCVVVPSLSEGFGYSAVEAATLGCRVVATEGHAVEEVLRGFVDLVPQNHPLALRQAIVRIARERPTRRPAPQRYTLASHVDGVLSVYAGATGKKWLTDTLSANEIKNPAAADRAIAEADLPHLR
jgi:glycosyltransferase involved in cell wall biosynthesis